MLGASTVMRPFDLEFPFCFSLHISLFHPVGRAFQNVLNARTYQRSGEVLQIRAQEGSCSS